MDINYVVATSCDADHKYHKNQWAVLTYKFLDHPNRYKRFWQPTILFYNNIWKLPAITRVTNTLSSLGHMSYQPRKDRLINVANYSLSFKLLHEVGYWDPDRIPEDYNIFFKSYFKKRGGVEVEPMYLPVYADAAQGESVIKTLKNEYEQKKRWAWGVSDDPWIIKNYLLVPGVPFWESPRHGPRPVKLRRLPAQSRGFKTLPPCAKVTLSGNRGLPRSRCQPNRRMPWIIMIFKRPASATCGR